MQLNPFTVQPFVMRPLELHFSSGPRRGEPLFNGLKTVLSRIPFSITESDISMDLSLPT